MKHLQTNDKISHGMIFLKSILLKHNTTKIFNTIFFFFKLMSTVKTKNHGQLYQRVI